MLRVDIMQAKPGMRLALPLQNPKAVKRTLLKADYELTEASIARVAELGVRTLWVSYPSLAAVEKYVTLESVQVQGEVVSQIADTFQDTQGQAAAKLDYATYSNSIRGMIDHVATNPKTSVFIGELSDSGDQTLRHASTVTYLSVLMGMKLESYMVRERKHMTPNRAKEVTALGVGAMLHDFGMTLLDDLVRERFEKEADESDAAWREHVILGFEAVRGQIDPSAAAVVLHHHQRYDGSGHCGSKFPVKAGSGIHVFARIVAVADEFDRLRHPAGLPEQPTVAVLNAMLSDEMRQRYDPAVLRAMLAVVPPYAPGTVLKLSDGRTAVAIDHNPGDPCRPVVQTVPDLDPDDDDEPEIIDLATMPLLIYVAECEGQPVGDFNFTGDSARMAA
jgi:HD-GYP domain-containing protein (c-di-GMP phosphodiesterase class II)